MSYERSPEYHDGQVKMACSVCGFPYVFPSELVRCDDKLLRCKRTCMEETALSRDRKIAASHHRREIQPPPFGAGLSYGQGVQTTVNCAGGLVVNDAGGGYITIPLLFFTDAYVGQAITLADTMDSANDRTHIIIAVIDMHTVRVASPCADQGLDATMTATSP